MKKMLLVLVSSLLVLAPSLYAKTYYNVLIPTGEKELLAWLAEQDFEVIRTDDACLTASVPDDLLQELYAHPEWSSHIQSIRVVSLDINSQAEAWSASSWTGEETPVTPPAEESRLAVTRPDLPQVEAFLKDLETRYPEFAKVSTLGTSQENRPVWAIRISAVAAAVVAPPLPAPEPGFSAWESAAPDPTSNLPNYLYTGATHGNEWLSTSFNLYFAKYLLAQMAADPKIKEMMAIRTLWIVPVVNPDGYFRNQRTTASHIDPNRDYPIPGQPDKVSDACIMVLRAFTEKYRINATVDYHTQGGMYFYPWSYTWDDPPSADKTFFVYLTGTMANAMSYQSGQISHLLWSLAKGCSADWYYWKFHSCSIGSELYQGYPYALSPENLYPELEKNFTPAIFFLSRAHTWTVSADPVIPPGPGTLVAPAPVLVAH